MSNDITQSFVRERYIYREDGQLIYRHDGKRLGSHRAGNTAGCTRSNGYRVVWIRGKLYMAHRIVWLWHYGREPEKFIDHINHDPGDNRISNLREVDMQSNMRNQELRSDNTSGFPGVSPNRNRWVARIIVNGAVIPLGRFKNKLDAVRARRAAESVYGFHENHGKAFKPEAVKIPAKNKKTERAGKYVTT